MSLPATIPQAILDTVVGRLALLFLTGAAGDLTAARDAAFQMLAAYNAKAPDELTLAAEIISFGFHALEALSQAANPDLSFNKTLRLRGNAVSLSRESHKSQRRLDQLQRVRAQQQPAEANPAPRTETAPASLGTHPAPVKVEQSAKPIAARGGESWSQSYQKRQLTKRMADRSKSGQAQQVIRAARLDPAARQAAA